MLRVALTGGMGSGKSTAAAVFRDLGCFVSQSDEVARAMMQPGEAVYRRIVQQLGPAVLGNDGSLDRAVLARLAFAEGRAAELNAIVHPAVIAWQNEWMRQAGEQDPGCVAMVESALVFETPYGASTSDTTRDPMPGSSAEASGQGSWRNRFDRILLVTAPEDLRRQRSLERYLARAERSDTSVREAALADIRARMQAQMPEQQKIALSDVVIENDGSLDALRQRVTHVWEWLRAEAAGSVR